MDAVADIAARFQRERNAVFELVEAATVERRRLMNRLRTVGQETAELRAEREELRTQSAALLRENAALRDDRNALQKDRDAIRRDRDRLRGHRDALLAAGTASDR